MLAGVILWCWFSSFLRLFLGAYSPSQVDLYAIMPRRFCLRQVAKKFVENWDGLREKKVSSLI